MQNTIINIDKVLKIYPSLETSGDGILTGFIEVDEHDLYQIEINYSNFPKEFPIVKELEGKIPRKSDRHVYEDGECCLTTKAIEQLLLRKNRITLLSDFIGEIVVPFFKNNSYFELNGNYYYGDYAHGLEGHFQSYAEILKITDRDLINDLLIKRINNRYFSKNDTCFCGSNKKIKVCHLEHYNDLYLIEKDLIEKDLIELRKTILEQRQKNISSLPILASH